MSAACLQRARAQLLPVLFVLWGPAGGVCAHGVVLRHHLSSRKCETSRCNEFYFEKAASPSEATDAIRSTRLWELSSLRALPLCGVFCHALLMG